jgi:N-acetylmuramoyl-L-alanine amidase
MRTITGKCSHFGGPRDTGVSPSEGLAFIYEVADAPHLFLPHQPPGTTGLARRLNPEEFYVACRWDYDETSKNELLGIMALVRSPKTGKEFMAYPADWGPHKDTGRVADLSPGLMSALGIETDDEVEVTFPYELPDETDTGIYNSIVMSSGHGKYVRGASGYLDEVDEARSVVEKLALELRMRGCNVVTFHDDVSKTQNENLNRIVDFHNSRTRQLDISVHFNAYKTTNKPMGTEVLYVTQQSLATELSKVISESGGFINRGPKKRTDLFFLNKTSAPAVLLEVCFVDSEADTKQYELNFNPICAAMADQLSGEISEPTRPPMPMPPIPEPMPPPMPRPPIPGPMPHPPVVEARVNIEIIGDVIVTVNGVPVS